MQELTAQFVLATDEVWRLQGGFDSADWRARGGSDPECLAFQAMAAAGHYGAGAGTKQGIYVCTPAGAFLASINSNRPGDVAAMLREGLQKWRALPATEREKAPPKTTAPQARFEWLRPDGGLCLTVTLRYLPESDDPADERDRSYNHDFLWFDADEVRRLVPKEPEVGAAQEWPRELFDRLARFNLVDAVRGETRSNREVSGSIRSEVTAVDGDLVDIRIEGRMQGRGTPEPRGLYVPLGIKAQVLGTGRFDGRRGRFVSFELVGKGVRWSAPHRGRGRRRIDPARGLGWVFTPTPEREDGFYIAPTHIREYGVAWARHAR